MQCRCIATHADTMHESEIGNEAQKWDSKSRGRVERNDGKIESRIMCFKRISCREQIADNFFYSASRCCRCLNSNKQMPCMRCHCIAGCHEAHFCETNETALTKLRQRAHMPGVASSMFHIRYSFVYTFFSHRNVKYNEMLSPSRGW